MIADAVVKVGASARNADGQILALQEAGFWVTHDELISWLADTTPVDSRLATKIERFRTRADKNAQLALIEAHGGFHSVLGFEEMKQHALIKVECRTLSFTPGTIIPLDFLSTETLACVRDKTQLVVPSESATPYNLNPPEGWSPGDLIDDILDGL